MSAAPTEQLVEDVAAVYFDAIGATTKRGVESDYLLPQLLSGNVRVKDAEQTLETTA